MSLRRLAAVDFEEDEDIAATAAGDAIVLMFDSLLAERGVNEGMATTLVGAFAGCPLLARRDDLVYRPQWLVYVTCK